MLVGVKNREKENNERKFGLCDPCNFYHFPCGKINKERNKRVFGM